MLQRSTFATNKFLKKKSYKDMMNFKRLLQSIVMFFFHADFDIHTVLCFIHTHLSVWSIYSSMLKKYILKSKIAYGFACKHIIGNRHLPVWQSKQTSETIEAEDSEKKQT